MLAWMLYSVLIAALACAAAWLAEPVARARRAPCRAVWAAAIAVSLFFAGWALRPPPLPVDASTDDTASVLLRVTTADGAGDGTRAAASPPSATRATLSSALNASLRVLQGRRTDQALAALWVVSLILGILTVVRSRRRLHHMRATWTTGRVAGATVLVSADVGPAVIGIVRTEVVVPSWVTALDAESQRLVVAHELEHVRAGDPALLHVAALLVRLMPWNLPLWAVERGLRHAIEVDCDERVLRGACDRRRYCALLLDVGERHVALGAPIPALVEPVTGLERRIEAMLTRPQLTRRTLLGAAASATLLAAACQVARPEASPFRRLMATRSSSARVAATDRRADDAASPLRADVTPLGDTTELGRSSRRAERLGAIADSVVLASHPEVINRPAGTPAFLGLVLDPHDRVLRHAVSLDPGLPDELAPALLVMHLDSVSARTLEMGMSRRPLWNLTVGHVVEATGPVHGRTTMRAWYVKGSEGHATTRQLLHIADSVARARTPAAFEPREGASYVIAMLLDSVGAPLRYSVRTVSEADSTLEREDASALLRTELGDPSITVGASAVMGQVGPPRRLIVWGVPR